MGSVHNLIGLPSNCYVPKVAVHNNIAIKFLFKKNIWAKYWWRILYFYHSIHSKIYSIIFPCQVYETLHCCLLWHWIQDSSTLLQAPLLWAVFHGSEGAQKKQKNKLTNVSFGLTYIQTPKKLKFFGFFPKQPLKNLMRIVEEKTERKTNISLFPADIHTYKLTFVSFFSVFILHLSLSWSV